MRMKQKTNSIVTALLLGVLGAVTLSAVITVPDWETARADLLIGMQYETTGLDLDAVPGWLAALVMLHQNFPLDGWAWGPAAAGLAVLLCWVRGQREAKPKRTELMLSIVFGIAEVLGLSICKLGSWAFVLKNPYHLCVGTFCMAGYAVLFYHAVWGLYALLGRSRTGGEDFPQTRFAAWFTKAPGRASSLLIGAAWLPWVAVFWPGSVDWDSWGQISQVLGVQEMTAHHTVLSTWLHGWLFRLGRAASLRGTVPVLAGTSGWAVSSLKYRTVMVMPLVTCISRSDRADISSSVRMRLGTRSVRCFSAASCSS